ncbi:MAG TPA: YdeI/OmpD-associated family protein [Flavobacteriales bacterium]|nr:YdeI/OmpD-associated family protein [Flavobacteriales bacterium]
MATTLAQKLRIKEGSTVVVINAPKNYARTLAPLPKGVTISDEPAKSNAFVHLFVENKTELEREFPKVVKTLAPDALLWISYPKGGKGIHTDLTRDRGWEILEKFTLRWLSLISFDGKWSAFLLQNAPPKEPSTASKNYHATSEEWADAKTKTVRMPDDLAAAFKKSAKAKASYEALSYSNKREYVLWVVGAKREETRAARVKGTIEKLLAGKKNPGEK